MGAKVLLFAVGLVSCIAFAEAPSKVDGSVTINGKKIPLKYAYAVRFDNEEGVADAPELRVLLSDREVDWTLLGVPVLGRLDGLAREGKLQGVLLRLDPKGENKDVQGTLLMAPSSSQMSLPFFTSTGTDTALKELVLKGDTASGTVEYEQSGEDSAFPDMPKFAFSATFSTPVRTSAITARLKGKDAVSSPQVETILAFEMACRAGDLEKARAFATESRYRELEMFVEQAGKEAFLQQAKEFIPDEATLRKQITEVVVRDKRAVVLIKEEGSVQSMDVTQIDGKWKAD